MVAATFGHVNHDIVLFEVRLQGLHSNTPRIIYQIHTLDNPLTVGIRFCRSGNLMLVKIRSKQKFCFKGISLGISLSMTLTINHMSPQTVVIHITYLS